MATTYPNRTAANTALYQALRDLNCTPKHIAWDHHEWAGGIVTDGIFAVAAPDGEVIVGGLDRHGNDYIIASVPRAAARIASYLRRH